MAADNNIKMSILSTPCFDFCSLKIHYPPGSFPGGSDGKESACNIGDLGSISGSRSPGEGNCYLFQYSCLENPMDRGTFRATCIASQRVGHNWVDNTFTGSQNGWLWTPHLPLTLQPPYLQLPASQELAGPSAWTSPPRYSQGWLLFVTHGLAQWSPPQRGIPEPPVHVGNLPSCSPSSQHSSLFEPVMFNNFFLAYCHFLSMRIKDLWEQDLAPSTDCVRSKNSTGKEPLLSLLGAHSYFFPGFSQLALQGAGLEWSSLAFLKPVCWSPGDFFPFRTCWILTESCLPPQGPLSGWPHTPGQLCWHLPPDACPGGGYVSSWSPAAGQTPWEPLSWIQPHVLLLPQPSSQDMGFWV